MQLSPRPPLRLASTARSCEAAGLLAEAHALLVELASRTGGGDAELRQSLVRLERAMETPPPPPLPAAGTIVGELTCRAVRADDRDVIIDEISPGIYDGHDYLPFQFSAFLDDPTKQMLACVDGADRVLGLDTVSTFDEGDTVMFQALRVHPRFQRQGVAKRLSVACNACIDLLSPRPRRLRVTTNSHNVESIALHTKLGFKHCLRMVLCGMHLTAVEGGDAELGVVDNVVDGVEAVSAAELWTLLKSGLWEWSGSGVEGSCEGGLPLLSLDWGVLECTRANLVALEARVGARFAVSYCNDGGVLFIVNFII
jgi:GNAT superfamily N-acetyltransferase|tara:strand:- start:738 stop:1673 length:936 start_codon:yes stop_codon:yes gene_type:complete